LTRYFYNRELEQPTAAMGQLLLVVLCDSELAVPGSAGLHMQRRSRRPAGE
jgi:hypothetical protein